MGYDFKINPNMDNNHYTKLGQEVLQECENSLKKAGIAVPIAQNSDKSKQKKDDTIQGLTVEKGTDNDKEHISKQFSDLSHSVNNAYAKAAKIENNLSNSASLTDSSVDSLLNTSRLVETMETIDDTGKRHLEFLNEKAPESGEASGSLNVYYENGTYGSLSTFLGNIENRWQNNKKNIYTKFNATFGKEVSINNEDSEKSQKIVGNIAFNGRLEDKKYTYGVGAEYNSYSNNTKILDLHVSGKHKATGIGADLTRRTTYSVDSKTGEHATVSSMKLKIDILSNKNSDDTDNSSTGSSTFNPFNIDTESSALPSEAVEASSEAKDDAAKYIKADRKNGFDADFEYDENVCGFTVNYNNNFYDNKDKILSLTPVAGIHDYTDPSATNNNESLKLTYGVIAQAGKSWGNGQNFTGSVTAIGNRIVKSGNKPFDSNYILANAKYDNPKQSFSTELDAGIIKSGDLYLKYADISTSKQFKHSRISLSAGIAKFNISGEDENLFNLLATYTYNIPYKTKK